MERRAGWDHWCCSNPWGNHRTTKVGEDHYRPSGPTISPPPPCPPELSWLQGLRIPHCCSTVAMSPCLNCKEKGLAAGNLHSDGLQPCFALLNCVCLVLSFPSCPPQSLPSAALLLGTNTEQQWHQVGICRNTAAEVRRVRCWEGAFESWKCPSSGLHDLSIYCITYLLKSAFLQSYLPHQLWNPTYRVFPPLFLFPANTGKTTSIPPDKYPGLEFKGLWIPPCSNELHIWRLPS